MSVAAAGRGVRALAILERRVRAPFRARHLYVSRMVACAVGRGPVGMTAVSRSRSHGFHRSASGDNDDADVRELIRAASRAGPPRPTGVGPRSPSMAIRRIDEDRPCEFGIDNGPPAQALGPRSRSCAVGSTAGRRA